MSRRLIKRSIGPLLGLAILTYLLSIVDFSRLETSWRSINYGLLAAGIILSQVSIYIRAIRWRYLLLACQPIPMSKLYPAVIVGMAANWIIPFRIGEMAGAFSLSRLTNIRFTTLAASVIADRLLDVLWLVGALALALHFLSIPSIQLPARLLGQEVSIDSEWLVGAARLLGMLFLAIVALMGLLYFRQGQILRLVDSTLGRVAPKLAINIVIPTLGKFADGLHVLRRGYDMLMSVLVTLVLWGMMLVGAYVLIASFPLATPPSLTQAFLVLICVAGGLTAPNAPGFVGTFHLAIVIGLLMADPTTDIDLAISFAIIYHLTQIVPTTLLGLFMAWRHGLSLMPDSRRTATFMPDLQDR